MLTNLELDIIDQLCTDKSVKEISNDLKMKTHVLNHKIQKLYKFFKVRNRMGLLNAAFKAGLIEL